jgi:hypothetical protein
VSPDSNGNYLLRLAKIRGTLLLLLVIVNLCVSHQTYPPNRLGGVGVSEYVSAGLPCLREVRRGGSIREIQSNEFNLIISLISLYIFECIAYRNQISLEILAFT